MRYRHAALVVSWLVVGLLATLAYADNEAYYLYQYNRFGASGNLSLESETAYGSRETRLLGADTWEQALRMRISGTDWLAIEAWGGAAFANEKEDGRRETETRTSFAGDLYFRALNQAQHLVNFSIGAGYLYDYQQTSIPRVRVTLDRSWGPVNWAFSALAEMPLGENEEEGAEEGEVEEAEEEEEGAYDEVDLLVSTALSYGATDWFRPGAEAVLEDMEGFWEEEEAEGGAKLVVGPTLAFAPVKSLSLRLNAAAVVPITTNTQTRVAGGTTQNQTGFLGRLAVGYTF
jgi:hypothetical protein